MTVGDADLAARLAQLEAENAELAARLKDPAGGAPARRWRGWVATVLIVLGSLLTPPAILSGWARVVLSDTDMVVATYGPLIKNPRVQAYLTDQVVAAVEQRVDVGGLIGEVVDGLAQTIQRPRAQLALEALRQPAIDGVRSAIRTATARVVESDVFAQAWQRSLRLSHGQAIAALQGDPESALTITQEGLGLRLAPLIAQVKQILTEQGFAFAAQIPAIDKTVVIAPAEALGQVQVAYRAALALGFWLGLVAFGLLVAGVAVAVRRHLAALWAAIGAGVGALLVLAAIGVGRVVAEVSVPASAMPGDVLRIFYDTVAAAVVELAAATLVLAVATGLVAWLSGPFRRARALRTGYAQAVGDLRVRAEAAGLHTGSVGEWLHAQRRPLQIGLAVLAVGWLVINRPLSAGLVVWTAVVAGLILVLLSVLERPAPAAQTVEGQP